MRGRTFVLLAGPLLLASCFLLFPGQFLPTVQAVCPSCPPPPPPAPTAGQLGGPYVGLSTAQTNLFTGGYSEFDIKWDPIRGLGPVFTHHGCFVCHGGGDDVLTGIAGDTTTQKGTRYGKWNPDNTFNYLDGNGTYPENEGGPIKHGETVAQFPTMPGCKLAHEEVPADATVVNKVRSPQLFGLGLVDNVSDADIMANAVPKSLGVSGIANMVPDENGVVRPGRFGLKANVVTLFQFTGNAFFNELGITNTLHPDNHLPQGNPIPSGCVDDPNSPEDVSNKDLIKTLQFQALLAPIAPQPPTDQTLAGQATFESTGCNLCHVESFTTQASVTLPTTSGGRTAVITPLSSVTFHPYSDFLLHDMGSGLSGGIPYEPSGTGAASLTMWRTAPLWGLSRRLSIAGGLMHNNSSTSVTGAILAHGGEAAQVISGYNALSSDDQANLLAFLNSL
jgi:CxxC motif-containing protein (DUF1111 family)